MRLMNLAIWKYRGIVNGELGSPIQKLVRNSFVLPDGSKFYEVYAKLNKEYVSGKVMPVIYGSSDGTGTDTSLMVATHKAISECLERWAYYDTTRNLKADEFGFDRDKSSSGMAAYPSLFKRGARNLAYLEAVERWALKNWWEGLLHHEVFEYESNLAVNILLPWNKIKVVVLCGQSAGFYYYGFSAGASVVRACIKAKIEFERNVRALTRFFERQDLYGIKESLVPQSIYEKRLVYFSTETGHQQFLQRVSKTSDGQHVCKIPECIVDREIAGPWSKYACVWRVLFSDVTQGAFSDDVEYFLF